MADSRFIRLPGTARRYMDTLTGEDISYREMYKREGRPSFEQIAATNRLAADYKNHMARYNEIVREYKTKKAEETGLRPSEIRVRGVADTSVELKKIVTDLKVKDNAPTGRKAAALVALGRRDSEWTWNVGETPGEGT